MTSTEILTLLIDNDKAALDYCLFQVEQAAYVTNDIPIETRIGLKIKENLLDHVLDNLHCKTFADSVVSGLAQHAYQDTNWKELGKHYASKYGEIYGAY